MKYYRGSKHKNSCLPSNEEYCLGMFTDLTDYNTVESTSYLETEQCDKSQSYSVPYPGDALCFKPKIML